MILLLLVFSVLLQYHTFIYYVIKFYPLDKMNVAVTFPHKLQVTINDHSQSLQSMKTKRCAVRGLL